MNNKIRRVWLRLIRGMVERPYDVQYIESGGFLSLWLQIELNCMVNACGRPISVKM